MSMNMIQCLLMDRHAIGLMRQPSHLKYLANMRYGAVRTEEAVGMEVDSMASANTTSKAADIDFDTGYYNFLHNSWVSVLQLGEGR